MTSAEKISPFPFRADAHCALCLRPHGPSRFKWYDGWLCQQCAEAWIEAQAPRGQVRWWDWPLILALTALTLAFIGGLILLAVEYLFPLLERIANGPG